MATKRTHTISVAAVIAATIATTAYSTASAFDAKRSGFVLGAGLGLTPRASLSTSYQSYDFASSDAGRSIRVLAGYGLNERDVLACEINIVSYDSDYEEPNMRLVQGIVAASWYHYLQPQAPSLFFMGGPGIYRAVEDLSGVSINICNTCGPSPAYPRVPETWGYGALAGAGYEFTKHFQITGYLSAGLPNGNIYIPSVGNVPRRATGTHMSLMLTWMGY